MGAMHVLARREWEPLAAAYRARAEAATADHRARRRRGEAHPLEDFLFEYYGFRPAQIARWHPGPGLALEDAPEHATWRHYATADGVTFLDLPAFLAARADGVRYALAVLRATHEREPQFACFGLHEWAMVYRLPADELRHASLPLRLGSAGTDAVVEAHEIRCSHYDAFRFFTDAARPLNLLRPTRDAAVDLEQPGCLHGGAMDLYRWAFKLAPAVPSEVVMDAFDLARDARILDMRSSPYDVRPLGYDNIAVETSAGKAEHVALQRAVERRSRPLRARLIAALEALLPGQGGYERSATARAGVGRDQSCGPTGRVASASQ